MSKRLTVCGVLAVLVLSLGVVSCTKTTATGGTSVCAVWQPIRWSGGDTPETVREVKANNAAWAVWCAEGSGGHS